MAVEAHRIAVISDTHGVLRPEVAERLNSCEAVFHAGDVGTPEIIEKLEAVCPAYLVRGNVDGSLAGSLPEELEWELFGFRFYMIHNRKQMKDKLPRVDMVICGHSHKYEESRIGQIPCLNPGSCGQKRFRLPLTMMLLTLYPAEHRWETERVDCAPAPVPSSTGEEIPQLSEKDMYRLIRNIMKDVDAGRPIGDIAARNRVSGEFAEQVCRMYLTHPGVDVDGIMDRLERKNL